MATHGAESWTQNKDIVQELATFKIKVLRRKFWGIKVHENWRKQYNKRINAAVRQFR